MTEPDFFVPTRDELNDACGPGPTLEEVKAAAARLEDVEAKGRWMVDGLLQIEQRIQRLRQALREVLTACDGLATEDVSDEVLCLAPGEVRARLAHHGRHTFAPIPVSERLPGPKDCCGNPRNGQGEWCWGRENPRTPAGTPVIWRLMRRDCLEDEAAQWAPWWAIPIPTTQDSNND
jgi:hypothetical protein